LRPAAQHLRALRAPAPSLRFVGAVDRSGGTQHPAVEILGAVRQPCRLVDGIADNGVFITVFSADVAGKDWAGRNPEAEVDEQPA